MPHLSLFPFNFQLSIYYGKKEHLTNCLPKLAYLTKNIFKTLRSFRIEEDSRLVPMSVWPLLLAFDLTLRVS